MNNPRRIQRHLVRALAAGALLAAAALPLAIATEAGALTTPTLTSLVFTPAGATSSTVASGASGTVAITGTNFVDNGGNVSITTNAAANTFTFSDVVETSATTATADYAASGTSGNTAAGTYNATLTDTSGSGTLNNAFTVTAAPTITGIAPTPIYEGTGANTVTITGTGFETGATVSFSNTANGTPLTDSVTSISSSGTSIVLSVTPTDPVNSAAASTGSYAVTVTNPDGGSVTDAAAFTVTNGIQEVSPSAVAGTAQASSDSVTLTGSGFEPGLTVAVGGAEASELSNVTVGAVTANSVVITFTETGTTAGLLSFTTTNPTVGGNGAVYASSSGAFGIGEASTVAPIITAATAPTTPVAVGSTGNSITLSGTGFSLYSVISSTATGVTFTAPTSTTGTSITAPLNVASGASEGAVPVKVTNTSAASATFADGFNVAGPAVTSSTPAAIAVGIKYGTTVTLTGTGFTPTTTLSSVTGGTGLAGVLSYVSATSLTLTVTTSPTTAGTATLNIVQSTATGNVLTTYALTVDPPPTISSAVTFPTGAPTDVGVGATATTVYINGGAFQKGATVTAFTNASGAADPDVTAKVTNVTPTVITATIAITAGDANNAVGYTVTNPDGGSVSTSATAYPILIGKGPAITTITPTTGAAGATTSFAVAGTGFEAGAVVTLSPANGTCGTATVSASTTLAVTCTLGTAGVTPTYLVVTNPDGGSATSTTAVLPAAVVVVPFHVSGVHGAAVVGKDVTITISGTGFYGQPKITAAGYTFGVTHDSGTLLTVKVTTKATGKAGEHLLTVILANGKSGKAGFNTKK